MNIYVDTADVDAIERFAALGAGDGFLANFIASLAHGIRAKRALALTNAVGAIATTQPGSVAALTSLDEIRRFRDDVSWAQSVCST